MLRCVGCQSSAAVLVNVSFVMNGSYLYKLVWIDVLVPDVLMLFYCAFSWLEETEGKLMWLVRIARVMCCIISRFYCSCNLGLPKLLSVEYILTTVLSQLSFYHYFYWSVITVVIIIHHYRCFHRSAITAITIFHHHHPYIHHAIYHNLHSPAVPLHPLSSTWSWVVASEVVVCVWLWRPTHHTVL